ncbi:unnamed protein product [Rotaria magnacalcarata]|uniref:Uncharacterized protein n=1 Tax=Rotaria magnacalcarata TaxID=392030 RepID=A0A816ZEU8_9BILA|nr:unnamed protein product [Rotaria magnacalcarata]CAF1646304.1 unnamed protein product [Rotaria magnacalcarata]CAF2026659.1 unnamed protein product [Rotaria magnacalcarata]CAF2094053.1 unnamed protein product [Rotaria magnacalcarata]CAF2201649.1 unnamed protein product [Rotaria magnacalcarata]
MNWLRFAWCAGSDLHTCPGRMLKARYNEMKAANCKNCDKFFHCKGNFDAVYRCGESDQTRRIAKKISDCREEAQDAGSADSRADQEANEFGRNGGECEKKYLCKVEVKLIPIYEDKN